MDDFADVRGDARDEGSGEVIGSSARPADVVIVGGGPRAVSVIERLTARIGGGRVRVVIIDAVEIGAGSTWRTDQRAEFLNNTYAAHTTIYPDASTPMTGPVTTGPDLAVWAKAIAAGEFPTPSGAPRRPDWVGHEVSGLRPWSFPSRRLQGVYYREQLAAILQRGGVELRGVVGTAVGVEALEADTGDPGPLRVVRLADGSTVIGRYIILAQGMVQAVPDERTLRFRAAAAAHGLTYIEPGMPSERDWDLVPAGQDVMVAGLGANFFDVLAALTTGRGGRLVPGDEPFEYAYLPSGNEPHLIAGSPRGLPYRSKSHYGALPTEYVPQLATAGFFESRQSMRGLDFRHDIWPQICRELVVAQLTALAEHHPESVPGVRLEADVLVVNLLQEIAETPLSGLGELVARYVIHDWKRQDPARLDRPAYRHDADTPSAAAWKRYVERWAADELESISAPLASPRAAVNRAMAFLRGRVAELVDAGAIDIASVLRDVNGWFLRLNIALASGPPPERTALLLALMRAGFVELIGEGSVFDIDDAGDAGVSFTGNSAASGQLFHARALIETRMSKGEVDVTNDPLLRSLLDTGRARLFSAVDAAGATVAARTLDVDPDSYSLRDMRGDNDSRVLVLGIPAGDVQPGSAIGATPGVPSPLIGGADRVAAQVLSHSHLAAQVVGGATIDVRRGTDEPRRLPTTAQQRS